MNFKMIGKEKRFSGARENAFTLLELLIVVALIGILTTIVIINISSAGPTARDGRRKADVNNIVGGIEQYYSENHRFPSSYPGDLLNNNFLTQEPKDPVTNASYNFVKNPATCDNGAGGNCSNYCAYTKLERNPGSGEGYYKYHQVSPAKDTYYYLNCSTHTFLVTCTGAGGGCCGATCPWASN